MNEINNKILAITDLAMKISQNSDADIFACYHGHINAFHLCGYSNGFESDIKDITMPWGADMLFLDIDYDVPGELDRALAKLETLWAEICKTKENAA